MPRRAALTEGHSDRRQRHDPHHFRSERPQPEPADFRQSNHEGELVDWIQEAREKACGIAINPAAYTHTSVAILDALSAFEGPVIEVHISNIHKREAWRHHSYVSLRADGIIAGLGIEGYAAAVRRICNLSEAE